MKQVDYLIIGAGPTGLGAARQLKKLGISSFLVLESGKQAGGLSRSFRDWAGFSWDVGGHVLFSENEAFIRLMDGLMGEDMLRHHRRARVRVADQWVDYPFQNHVHQLTEDLAWRCREDMDRAPGPGEETRTFKDWIRHCFGDSIAKLFMEPYNRKVWGCALHLMGFQWVKARISTGREKAVDSAVVSGWGANSSFGYPRSGGIGTVFSRMAEGLEDHILFGQEVVSVDLTLRIATTHSGDVFEYKALLSTAPLDRLIKEIMRPDCAEVVSAADRLQHNSVFVVGLGVDTAGDTDTSWMYFPDSGCPFYRLTNLHNYAPDITPAGNGQSALMAEIALAETETVDPDTLILRTIEGLIKTGLLKASERKKIISRWYYYAPYGYPIPTLMRDDALSAIHPYLEQYHVCSRGRFGGWKYEIGNMDHSVMQGIEWADRIVTGAEESVYTISS